MADDESGSFNEPEESAEDESLIKEAAALAALAWLLAARKRRPVDPDDETETRALREIAASRRRSERLLDRTVMRPVRRSYDEHIGRTVAALGRLFRGQMRRPATAQTVATARAFLQQAMPGLSRQVNDVLFRANQTTATEGIRSTSRFLRLVQKMGSPLDDVATASRIELARRQATRDLQKQATAALAIDLTNALSKRIDKMPGTKQTVGELISAAGVGLDEEWWRLERLVRTTTSSMHNEAMSESIDTVALDPEFQGLAKRWTEMVDDATGMPLDTRVGRDSLVLHGQVARPGRLFTMPPDPLAPVTMVGQSWRHPPNRPNDRAVLTPWMPGWKIPAWAYQAGTRVSL